MSYKVIDNFLDKSDFERLQAVMLSNDFPWYFLDHKVSKITKIKEENKINNFQFIHNFYSNFSPSSPFAEILNPILEKINPSAIVRIKANLTTPTPNSFEFGWHTDYGYEKGKNFTGKTAVFYVNTNDGKTLFENGESVEAIENRILIFDADMVHTGTSSTDSKQRIVININFYEWQD